MSVRKSQYRTINFDKPVTKAFSDQMAIICDHRDLRPVMEYNGDGPYWTGKLEYKDFLLKPNEQFLALKLAPDPLPITNPRPILINMDD